MITVGIRELKQQTSELIRRVREEGSEIQVTYHGKVVARLVPVRPPEPFEGGQAWADLDHLAAQVGERWPHGVSAAEAVSDGRRE
jgi:prevent-host-death family protein